MNETADRASPLKAAGELVGLLAGLVAALYVLGGLLLAIRLLSDGFSGDTVVSLLGQVPRELLVSAGLLQAIGPAALTGTAAALVYGLLDGPRPRAEVDGEAADDRLDKPPNARRNIAGLVALALLFMVPGLWLSARTGDGVSRNEWIAFVAALALTTPAVFAGWFVKRRVARKRSWYRLSRAIVGGAIWTGMALIPALFAVGVVPFEDAQLCLKGTRTPEKGATLIAQTKDRTLLALEKASGENRERIVSLPTSEVSRLEFGQLDPKFSC